MKKIGLFYAPAGGSTERAAKKIVEFLGEENVEMKLIEDNTPTSVLDGYSQIILGISTVGRDTWDSAYSKIGWDFFLPRLEDYNFEGKTVAIFGLGNHIMYPENFQDAMGLLGPKVMENKGNLIGRCASSDFSEFENMDSDGMDMEGVFYGLPLDEDNLSDLTDERVEKWVTQIKGEM